MSGHHGPCGRFLRYAFRCLGPGENASGRLPRPDVPGTAPTGDLLTVALGALGWTEGRNVVLERRYADGQTGRLTTLAAELVGLDVSVIVAFGTPAAQAAKDATTTIPIVIVGVADPVRSGLVTSLSRPGGNVTGIAMAGPEITQKRLQLLKEILPRASHVGIVFDPSNQGQLDLLTDTRTAAAALGLRIQHLKVNDSAAFDGVFAEAVRTRVDALVLYPLNRSAGWVRDIATLAIAHRLPLLTGFRSYAEQGAFLGKNIVD